MTTGSVFLRMPALPRGDVMWLVIAGSIALAAWLALVPVGRRYSSRTSQRDQMHGRAKYSLTRSRACIKAVRSGDRSRRARQAGRQRLAGTGDVCDSFRRYPQSG